MNVEAIHVYLAVAGLIGVLALILFFGVFKKLIKNRALLMVFAGVLGVLIILLILPVTRVQTIGVFTSIYQFFVNVRLRAELWYSTNARWLKTQTDTISLWFKLHPTITNGIILTVGVVAVIQIGLISIKYVTERALRYAQKKMIYAFAKTVVAFVVSAYILSTSFIFIDPYWTQTIKVLASVMISQGVASEGLLGLLKDAILNVLWRPE